MLLFNCRGLDFRTDYGKLGVLCAMFPDVPVLAMTATANRGDIKCIQDSLGLKSRRYIVTNPDRKNICYKKIFRSGQDIDSLQSILIPIGCKQIPLKLCGFAYKLFERVLGDEQYFPPGCPSTPI